MAWTRLLPLGEVPVGSARPVRLGPDELLVCRPADAVVYVLEDVCSHDGSSLGAQDLDGGAVTCPRHGARFDIASGAVLRSPAPVGIAVFPARIALDWVEADLED
ncbi:MAG TPA: Rieske 2Fe-2S domain-containing protein [Candidatus Krumholzibacteria bacterium]|nr:Rieske 2Fe-2S domain-containing protein [Candidatus Krumholzibacteria bacterium]HPD71175.1 Rieske 2Fe-2S domain-containing protein [Candidatus Krumholzibacteria bacterium]HRY39125.1 Rieske 2Fe-2S domain-containing protein [Candidatus Krumholzibacteria bacterium]